MKLSLTLLVIFGFVAFIGAAPVEDEPEAPELSEADAQVKDDTPEEEQAQDEDDIADVEANNSENKLEDESEIPEDPKLENEVIPKIEDEVNEALVDLPQQTDEDMSDEDAKKAVGKAPSKGKKPRKSKVRFRCSRWRLFGRRNQRVCHRCCTRQFVCHRFAPKKWSHFVSSKVCIKKTGQVGCVSMCIHLTNITKAILRVLHG